jgi:hypothetical protein
LSYPPPSDPTHYGLPEEPMSGQPWSAPTGDAGPPAPPGPPRFRPGSAPLPQSGSPDGYPPTEQFPPVPGYGAQQVYEQPPGPPPSYPPPPSKRSKAPLIAVLIAVTLLLCAGGVTAVVLAVNKATDKAKEAINDLPTAPPDLNVPDVPTQLPTDLPNVPGLPDQSATVTVEYEVTGDGPAQIFYVEEGGQSPKQLTNQQLPWTKTITVQGVGLISVVAGRLGFSDGDITCSIKVDGKEVASKSGTGNVATTECTKLLG